MENELRAEISDQKSLSDQNFKLNGKRPQVFLLFVML